MVVFVTHYSRVKTVEIVNMLYSVKIKSLHPDMRWPFNRSYKTRNTQTAFIVGFTAALFKYNRIYHIINSARFRFSYKHPPHDPHLRSRYPYAKLSSHGFEHVCHGLSYPVCDLGYFSAVFSKYLVALNNDIS